MFGAFHLMFISVNNLSDARYAAALGADYLSFNFDPHHPMSVTAASAKAMAQWVSGPLVGAELTREHNSRNALDFVEILGLDLMIVSAEQAESMEESGVDFMVRHPSLNQDMLNYLNGLSHFKGILLVAEKAHLLDFADPWPEQTPVFVVLPELSADIVQWVLKRKPYGIALQGEMEDTPGYRDFEEVNAFFDQLEEASSAS